VSFVTKGALPRTDPTEADRRRSQRVRLAVQVDVAWRTSDGARHSDHAKSEVVSAYGGLLQMNEPYPPLKQVVELYHPSTHRSCRARVVWIMEPESGESARIAIELAIPSQAFWGISFPPAD
jgi:hypothetical protein